VGLISQFGGQILAGFFHHVTSHTVVFPHVGDVLVRITLAVMQSEPFKVPLRRPTSIPSRVLRKQVLFVEVILKAPMMLNDLSTIARKPFAQSSYDTRSILYARYSNDMGTSP
jgi:hypothetical protein